jgi:hypothetical protein
VPAVNAGLNVPLDNVKPFKSALLLEALVTVMVYVFVVPSSAVTTTLMVLTPTLSGSEPAAEPFVRLIGPYVPSLLYTLAVTVALPSDNVGVNARLLTLFATLEV